MDWISFWIGFLAGLFSLITIATMGIIRANKRLGIDLPGMATQWYKSRRLIKESGITTNLEREDTRILGEPSREETFPESSGTGNSADSEKSVLGTKETSSD